DACAAIFTRVVGNIRHRGVDIGFYLYITCLAEPASPAAIKEEQQLIAVTGAHMEQIWCANRASRFAARHERVPAFFEFVNRRHFTILCRQAAEWNQYKNQ